MRELLIFLNAAEARSEARVISAPSILASDNLPATISVGTEIPMLSSQVFGLGAQTASNPVFTNTIQNRDTGVLLTITPRVNSSGLVKLQIYQEVSAPLAPLAGAIQSPSISKRSVSTQVVVQDGETIALGGSSKKAARFRKTASAARRHSLHRCAVRKHVAFHAADGADPAAHAHRHPDTSEARQATAEFRNKLRDLSKILDEEENESRSEEKCNNSRKASPPDRTGMFPVRACWTDRE